MIKAVEFIKREFIGFGNKERIYFPLTVVLIALFAIKMHDVPIAILSAICGVIATITAGKGKISCYIFGIMSNICYAYISYMNGFWGNLVLNILYYLPLQFVGIHNWKKHLKQETQQIYKTKLTPKEKSLYFTLIFILCILGYYILQILNDSSPIFDSVTTVLSMFAFIFTVKRCIEQWYLWTIVNALCTIMWIGAFIHGSHCFATILMWGTYFILGLYFFHNWNKEINNNK